jgi:hypothetical protein
VKLDRSGTPKKIAKVMPVSDYQRLERLAYQQQRYLATLIAALVVIILGLIVRAIR